MRASLIFSGILFFSLSCSQKSSYDKPALKNTLASYEPGRDSDNPIISVEPSENVSLEDYWEEANSIQIEAEQILQMSESIQCSEASVFAREALTLTTKTANSRDFSEAERLIGEAGEMVQNAEDALVLCQDQP